MLAADAYATLLAALAGARHAAGLTQAEVANKLKKPQSFVSKYEQGERRLDVVEFVQVCRAIGVDPLTITAEIRDLYEVKSAHRR